VGPAAFEMAVRSPSTSAGNHEAAVFSAGSALPALGAHGRIWYGRGYQRRYANTSPRRWRDDATTERAGSQQAEKPLEEVK
jgi:hypothetical protein